MSLLNSTDPRSICSTMTVLGCPLCHPPAPPPPPNDAPSISAGLAPGEAAPEMLSEGLYVRILALVVLLWWWLLLL